MNRKQAWAVPAILITASLLALSAGLLTAGQEKVRVYVTDSKSWEIGSAGTSIDDIGIGGGKGGARPQTAEIIKTFGDRCPSLVITNNREKADYVVLLDHEGGKAPFLRDNKVVIFDREGDAIHSGSTRSLGNAVKDACAAILKTEDSAGRP